jgi:uncharacterized protein YqgC (DUF456 family)
MPDTGGVEILVALAIVVGVVGIVLPILPGILLVASAIAIWAAVEGVWWLLAVVVVLAAVAVILKIAIPARTARDSASTIAMAVGAVAALVGFFVIPLVGAIVGFLAGVLITELARLRVLADAWRATWSTAKSVGLTMAIELLTALVMAGLWVSALVAA